MKFKFDEGLDFQLQAIQSVVELFAGQERIAPEAEFGIVANKLAISRRDLLENLQRVQTANGLPLSELDDLEQPYNFTVEMETGTGKTYVYLRTILELHREYGLTKFVIVVPSVAIKEGVLKTLEITREHFEQLYDNIPYKYFEYRSDQLVKIKDFALSNYLQIMVITRDSFNKDSNIIHNVRDGLGDKPIDLIRKIRPVVVLDEPQKMGGEATTWGIEQLNPLFVLRYSATHKDIFNLVYKLTPYEAYNQGLVKKIEVLSVTEDADASSKKIILERVDSVASGLRARVKVFCRTGNNIILKSITLKHGDNLAQKTSNDYYNGFIVSEINRAEGFVAFTNGVKVIEGQSSEMDDIIIRTMVRETIREHFDKKRRLNPKGIKVLSLFFLNRVDDYMLADGKVRLLFTEEFNNIVASEYPEFAHTNVELVHNGYFSAMKKDSSIENDEEAYNLIMRDKERLLSLEEPVEFIFSHSALREGWDNPNVFNICTLSYSTSDIKKRQEIGRGLRLPVDQSGNRIFDNNINILTVITNETYSDYVSKLQTEYMEEVGQAAPPVQHRRRRVMLKKKHALQADEEYRDLWAAISPIAKYIVNIKSEKLIDDIVKELNQISLSRKAVHVSKVLVTSLSEGKETKEHRKERSELLPLETAFNLIDFLVKGTGLSRKTIVEIVRRLENLDSFVVAPQQYAERAVEIINYWKNVHAVEQLEYVDLDEYYGDIFDDEISGYDDQVIYVKKSLYDGVIVDSRLEREFVKKLDEDVRVKKFLKLPRSYVINTPVGKYTPDWAVVAEKTTNGKTKEVIYVIVETKGGHSIYELRPKEQLKIKSAVKRFLRYTKVRFKAYISPPEAEQNPVDYLVS